MTQLTYVKYCIYFQQQLNLDILGTVNSDLPGWYVYFQQQSVWLLWALSVMANLAVMSTCNNQYSYMGCIV